MKSGLEINFCDGNKSMRARCWKSLIAALALALAACGGGGDGEADAVEKGYYGVIGLKNGSIATICIDGAAFTDPKSASGDGITRNVIAYYGLSGDINSYSGTGQSCLDKFPLASTVLTIDYYNSVVRGAANVTPESTPQAPPTSVQYVNWIGSSNNEVIRDKSNDAFAVDAVSRALVYLGNGTSPANLTGLTVDGGGKVVDRGTIRGSVVLGPAVNSTQIAVLSCLDGAAMDIVITSGWSLICGTSTSTGSTGGAATPTPRAFINWVNSVNGVTVKDANNESFAFYSDTRCLYSYNTQSETSNFCLSGANSGSFAGQAVSITRARAVGAIGGGCIAVLSDPNGFQIDIFTSPAGVQIVQRNNTQWDSTGC